MILCRVTDPPLELETTDVAFRPNPTTVRFARAVQIKPGDVVFDIGTGIGPLAIVAALNGASRVYAVDPVAVHCEMARRNVAKYKVQDRVTVLHGGYFDPFDADPALRQLRANVIIGDVSGIADGAAKALGWYSDDVPTGGEDGTEPIRTLLTRAVKYLRPDGALYFPVATDLSDGERIVATANRHFSSVTNAFDKTYFEFPLTPAEVAAIEAEYAKRGGMPPYIRLLQNDRRVYWRGQILVARGPKQA